MGYMFGFYEKEKIIIASLDLMSGVRYRQNRVLINLFIAY